MLCTSQELQYDYVTTFNIVSEKSLDDFWSYFIFRLNLEQNEHTYDRFARLYNVLSGTKKIFSAQNYINISLKESNEKFFLYIETAIDSIIQKMSHKLEVLGYFYEIQENVLHYTIDKIVSRKIEQTRANNLESEQKGIVVSQDDLDAMTQAIQGSYDSSYAKIYIVDITYYKEVLVSYADFLKYYPDLLNIHNSISELALILSVYHNQCDELGGDLKVILQGFMNNLWHWHETYFISGDDNIHYMDDSFNADLSQIKVSLGLYDQSMDNEEVNVDDIFDFDVDLAC